MSARIIAIAEAVASLMSAYADWSQPVDAEMRFAPKFRPEQLSTLTVIVAPVSRERAYQARGADQLTYEIDIGVFKHITGSEADRDVEVESLIELVDEFEDFWMRRSLTVGGIKLTTIGTDTDPVYDAELLRETGVFGSVMTLTLTEVLR